MAAGERLSAPPGRAAGQRCASDPALPGVADIDWSVPWLAEWRAWGEPMAARIAAGAPQPEVLSAAGRAPVRFVPQTELPDGMAYEAFVQTTGQVPTRAGLHDFFNALCWMHFPQAKRQLNRLQALAIERDGVQARRGPVRDAITVFDENAVLIQAPESVWQALRSHRWQEALVMQRAAWLNDRVRLWMFGHAALEKLVQPYKSITVHLWRVPDPLPPDGLDAWLAQDLSDHKLATKPFAALPVLGVPGWCPANADPAFYDDAEVFRPLRRRPAPEKPSAAREIP